MKLCQARRGRVVPDYEPAFQAGSILAPQGAEGRFFPMNIFARKDEDQVRVPEIEVRGDEVRVQGNDGEHGQKREREQDQKDRSYRLPKTKWF